MMREGQLSVALLPLALVGATLGFLPYNFNPAKVFMGSGGSYFLGWAVAALGIIGGAKVATVLLAMGLPILDVAWLIYNRSRQSAAGRRSTAATTCTTACSTSGSRSGRLCWLLRLLRALRRLALLLENRLYKVMRWPCWPRQRWAVFVWAARQPAGKYVNGHPPGVTRPN
jgi:UDP-GlcNAc:undecaprenyl-phosphate/decaprenyl-phosphate GlcNAc-1-phosphate transferase